MLDRDFLNEILHRSTMGLAEVNQMPVRSETSIIRVHFESIQAATINKMREIETEENRKDINSLYRREVAND